MKTRADCACHAWFLNAFDCAIFVRKALSAINVAIAIAVAVAVAVAVAKVAAVRPRNDKGLQEQA
ncbi:hypothetical protein [Comamonas avium]|uniref:Uncharacterized protein n=1 Tax=Comamonas avium TaxID=2762231 RepID=A0ABR8S5X7_9BURK|nr:hypothetical protein [Comamonas avium]MBD7958888.1 hypothetical protein [Comamonas avium]